MRIGAHWHLINQRKPRIDPIRIRSFSTNTKMQTDSCMKILLVGDVMLGRLIDQLFPTHVDEPEDAFHAWNLLKYRDSSRIQKIKELKHKYVWGDVLDVFHKADTRLINLETSVTTHSEKWPYKVFNYRMHPDNLQCLKEARIDYCSMANNHTLDFGYEGMVETIQSLKKNGFHYAGVGNRIHEAQEPAIFRCKSKTIAAFSLADHPPEWLATESRPGIWYLDVSQWKKSDIAQIQVLVQRAREKHRADIVVFSIHWGSNYCWVPPDEFQQFAHQLIDTCGVDIIHGHSSHHVQGIEIYKGKPILYGCGDFVDDYAVDPKYRNDLGFAYTLNLDENTGKLQSIELTPTCIEMFSVNKVTSGPQYLWLFNTMMRLCQMFGTKLEKHPDGKNFIINCK